MTVQKEKALEEIKLGFLPDNVILKLWVLGNILIISTSISSPLEWR